MTNSLHPKPTGFEYIRMDGITFSAPSTIRPQVELNAIHPMDLRKPPTGRITRDELRARCAYAMGLNLPTALHCVNEATSWAVVGGGPSINQNVDRIRKLKAQGVAIVSVNKSHDWLLEHGIVPWGHILLDPKDWVAGYVARPRMDVRYFIASQCHQATFERLIGYPVFLWHAGQDFPEDNCAEPDNYLREHFPASKGHNWQIVPGGTTVGMRAPMLGHHMIRGVDKFHMFGMDSSRTAGRLHAYAKPEPADGTSGTVKLWHNGKKYAFDTHQHMKQQFEDFDRFISELGEHFEHHRMRKAFQMKFYGSGLLPFYAATLGLHADAACNADPELVGGFTIELTPQDRYTQQLKMAEQERLALANNPAMLELQAELAGMGVESEGLR